MEYNNIVQFPGSKKGGKSAKQPQATMGSGLRNLAGQAYERARAGEEEPLAYLCRSRGPMAYAIVREIHDCYSRKNVSGKEDVEREERIGGRIDAAFHRSQENYPREIADDIGGMFLALCENQGDIAIQEDLQTAYNYIGKSNSIELTYSLYEGLASDPRVERAYMACLSIINDYVVDTVPEPTKTWNEWKTDLNHNSTVDLSNEVFRDLMQNPSNTFNLAKLESLLARRKMSAYADIMANCDYYADTVESSYTHITEESRNQTLERIETIRLEIEHISKKIGLGLRKASGE